MAGCDRCESNVRILPGPAGGNTARRAVSQPTVLRALGFDYSAPLSDWKTRPGPDRAGGERPNRILLLGHLRDSGDLERTVPVRVMISSVNEYGVRGSRRDCLTSVHKVKGFGADFEQRVCFGPQMILIRTSQEATVSKNCDKICEEQLACVG